MQEEDRYFPELCAIDADFRFFALLRKSGNRVDPIGRKYNFCRIAHGPDQEMQTGWLSSKYSPLSTKTPERTTAPQHVHRMISRTGYQAVTDRVHAADGMHVRCRTAGGDISDIGC